MLIFLVFLHLLAFSEEAITTLPFLRVLRIIYPFFKVINEERFKTALHFSPFFCIHES